MIALLCQQGLFYLMTNDSVFFFYIFNVQHTVVMLKFMKTNFRLKNYTNVFPTIARSIEFLNTGSQ